MVLILQNYLFNGNTTPDVSNADEHVKRRRRNSLKHKRPLSRHYLYHRVLLGKNRRVTTQDCDGDHMQHT